MAHNARPVTINKAELIEKIKANKVNHIKDYDEAVIAYRNEAKKQLEEQLVNLANGSLGIKLALVSPINKSEEYDKILEMYEWEIADEVTLSQDEFKEHVQDQVQFAIHAKLLNSTYR